MLRVATNHDPVEFEIPLEGATDNEGNPISLDQVRGQLIVDVTSDNPQAVAVTQDAENPLRGAVAFGKPNLDGTPALASVTAQIWSKNKKNGSRDELLHVAGAQFAIPPGDLHALTVGKLQFKGIEEEVEAPTGDAPADTPGDTSGEQGSTGEPVIEQPADGGDVSPEAGEVVPDSITR